MNGQPYLWIWLIGAPIVLAIVDLLRTRSTSSRRA